MLNKINKKGELTTQQIVLLVILIVSFVIILFFFSRLNLKDESQKQICHNSVVLKDKSLVGTTPLDCRTNYVCISGGGKCDGITPSQTYEVNPKNKSQILRAVVMEMSDCWWQFGEGKLDYVGVGNKGVGINTCAVCSIVKFDKTIQDNAGEITYSDLINELNKPKDKTETYLKYLYGVDSPKELYETFENIKDDVDSGRKIPLNGKFMIRTGFAAGFLFGIPIVDPNIIIYPYFFETNDIPDPQCTVFVTKA